jgi:Plasma-membrane choline transporter
MFFSKDAYIHVAIYGDDYITAAKATWALIKSRGIDLIINDDLSGMVLTMGMFMVAAGCAVCAGLWAYLADIDEWGFIAGVGALSGAIIAVQILSIIESSVGTIFVVWAEDPAGMKQHRPEEYNNIVNAANRMYGDRYNFA